MLPKTKSGSVLIPLIIVLALSLGILLASKFFSTSQANVETAIDSRYQLSPSAQMDNPENWISEDNKQFDFNLYYPKQWVASQSPKGTGSEIFILEKALSKKVILRLTVYKNYEIPTEARQAKFDKNIFYILKEEENHKASVMKTEENYYLIELSHNNYFPTELEFTGTYFQLLKKFRYTGN